MADGGWSKTKNKSFGAIRHPVLNETLQTLSLRHSINVSKRNLFFHHGTLRQICVYVYLSVSDRFLPEFFRYADGTPHYLAQKSLAVG